METAGKRTRRTARAMLLGSALAVLLTVTTAGAASGAGTDGAAGAARAATGAGTEQAAPAAPRVDVYMRDFVGDSGAEPHTSSSVYQSPDIKVCPGVIECASSQNPTAGGTNWVFVTLHRPGPADSPFDASGTVKLYYTAQGGSALWDSDWTEINTASVIIPAAATTVTVPLKWEDVPGPGHFCLLARWVSAQDPMAVAELPGSLTITNTRNNNNIIWRNVDSVAPLPGGDSEVRPYTIGNGLDVPTHNDIVFTQPGGRPLPELGGRLVVDLGQTLFERWRRGGGVGVNVRQVGSTQFEIVDPRQARLGNLVLEPKERLSFRLLFSAKAGAQGQTVLNVAQWGQEAPNRGLTDIGGVGYEILLRGRQ